jgi:Flp pilus assembly protein TadD
MAIELLPNDPKAYNNRGWVRQQLGDWRGAVADYRRALDLAPSDWSERDLVEGNLAAARARITANGS